MKWLNVTCDNCGRNITNTGNCEDWRITLENERMPSVGGFVTSMAISPKLDKNVVFCGIACLKTFVAKL